MVHKKVKIALSSGLAPIICVGETFQERQDGAKDYILIQQVTKALEGVEIKPEQKVVVAYEPVWVIGSGQAIEPQEAMAAHQVIYQTLLDLFPLGLVGSNFRIIYGGSVDESNVASFTRLENTFGVLVGGASLKADDFLAIIKNV
jgi:triosephosphate isomerase